MRRLPSRPRPDWTSKLESVGVTYHTHDSGPYWDESAYYELTAAEVDQLESATNTLHQLFIEAGQAIIDRSWWSRLGIPGRAVAPIERSWAEDDFSLYGRFDLAFDGRTPPKLLEYNADTPTALIEASVAQWFWLQDLAPDADQFNSIHERLIDAWKTFPTRRVHFCAVRDHPEDDQTIRYLRDTCTQAGHETDELPIEELGWNDATRRFVDLADRPVDACFKLYPWEWMWDEAYAPHIHLRSTHFIEPVWKMLFANKGILPILWELYPDHPNLLPAYTSPEPLRGNHVKKPRFGREGANVTLTLNGRDVARTEGEYADDVFIYQAAAPMPEFDGHRPVFGTWVVDHEAAGLGIREDTARITSNISRFVPHLFR